MKSKGETNDSVPVISIAPDLEKGTKQEYQEVWTWGWAWRGEEQNESRTQRRQPSHQGDAMGYRPRRNQKTRKGRNATGLSPSFLHSPSGGRWQWDTLWGLNTLGLAPTYLLCAKQAASHQGHVTHFLLATVLLAPPSYQGQLTKTSCGHLETFRPLYPTLVLAGFQLTFMISCLAALERMDRSLLKKQTKKHWGGHCG